MNWVTQCRNAIWGIFTWLCFGLLVLPLDLSADYGYGHIKPMGVFEPLPLAGAALLLGLLMFSILGRKRFPFFAFWASRLILSFIFLSMYGIGLFIIPPLENIVSCIYYR